MTWNTVGAKTGVTSQPGTSHQPQVLRETHRTVLVRERDGVPNIEELAKRDVIHVSPFLI